jgi:hypothetical protein
LIESQATSFETPGSASRCRLGDFGDFGGSAFAGPKSADDDGDDLDDTPDDIQTIYEQVGYVGFGRVTGRVGMFGISNQIKSDMSRCLGHVKASRQTECGKAKVNFERAA